MPGTIGFNAAISARTVSRVAWSSGPDSYFLIDFRLKMVS